MTPVCDIELEMVLRISVRGQTRDLARLLDTMSQAAAVVIWVVDASPNRKSRVRRI